MPKKLQGKSVSLTPNLRFRQPQAMARTKKAWKQLFELLYEYQITAVSVSEFGWRVEADNALVQLIPLPADNVVWQRSVDETTDVRVCRRRIPAESQETEGAEKRARSAKTVSAIP